MIILIIIDLLICTALYLRIVPRHFSIQHKMYVTIKTGNTHRVKAEKEERKKEKDDNGWGEKEAINPRTFRNSKAVTFDTWTDTEDTPTMFSSRKCIESKTIRAQK